MPRISGATNATTYHYCIESKSKEDPTKIIKKYYKTTEEIKAEFGLCRSAIFSLATGKTKKSKNQSIIKIEKLDKPKPKYRMVLIQDDE